MNNDMQIGAIYFGDDDGWLEKETFYLPHSCDQWVIGDLAEAKQFLADLQELIKEVEDKG